MRKIELSGDDKVTIKVDGKPLRTTFDVVAAKKALKAGGPALIDMAVKHLHRKLEDDPVTILKPDELQHIERECKRKVMESQ